MRLWVKISALCAAVLLAAAAVCAGALLWTQESAMRRADERNAEDALAVFCSNVREASEEGGARAQGTALRSVTAYYFSKYAKAVQTEGTRFSLAADGAYLFHTSPQDPLSLFESPSGESAYDGFSVTLRRVGEGEEAAIVAQCPFRVADQCFEAYLSVDVSGTEARIGALRLFCFAAAGLACAAAAAAAALLVRRALKPVQVLTRLTASIADGDYRLRTGMRRSDELGELSASFDRMADAVEDKIRRLDEELEKRRLLLGALSHELRTPMTAVVGYADSLLRMPLTESQREACARRIYEAGRHTENLSQKMTELVGLEGSKAVKRDWIDPEVFAGRLRTFLPPQVEITTDGAPFSGDETLLTALAVNLAENALRASGSEPRVRVRLERDGAVERITVSDEGCGIPADQIPLIFDPFYRVNKARSRRDGGAGLGLALCRLICERHGGMISVESEVGRGTTVTAVILQLDDNSRTT